jgi:hypothetical protein
MKTFRIEVEELTYDTFEIQAESTREVQDIVLRKLTETVKSVEEVF